MAISVQVTVLATINDYHAMKAPAGSGIPVLPLVVPTAMVSGLSSLDGSWTSQTDLKAEADYAGFVKGIVQSRLGPGFSVQLLESTSRPNIIPPPWWIYDPNAYAFQLTYGGAVYTETKPGQSAQVDVGWIIAVHALP